MAALRSELIEDRAERKDIAAPVRAHADELLWVPCIRSFPPADGTAPRADQVASHAATDRNRSARRHRGAEQDIRRLEIEVQHVLLVQAGERGGHLRPEPYGLVDR